MYTWFNWTTCVEFNELVRYFLRIDQKYPKFSRNSNFNGKEKLNGKISIRRTFKHLLQYMRNLIGQLASNLTSSFDIFFESIKSIQKFSRNSNFNGKEKLNGKIASTHLFIIFERKKETKTVLFIKVQFIFVTLERFERILEKLSPSCR